jgi:hypothetical protein
MTGDGVIVCHCSRCELFAEVRCDGFTSDDIEHAAETWYAEHARMWHDWPGGNDRGVS